MEIQFATSAQNGIADLMWKAKDMDEVNELIRVFGTDGLTDEDVEAIMDDYNYVGNKSHY